MTAWRALATLISHWRRNPVQICAVIAGLTLATALWSAVQAINGEARASYARAAALLGEGDALAPVAGAWAPEELFARLRRAGWDVSPVVEGRRMFGDRRYRVLGVELVSAPPRMRREAFDEGLADGGAPAFLTPPWRVVAAPATVRALAGVADELPPLVEDAAMPEGVLLTDIGVAQRLLGREGWISRLLLPPGQAPPDDLLAELDLKLTAASDDAALAGLTESFHLNLTAFAFLAYIVGFVIVHAAIGLATEQRLPMFRTLRACGLSARALLAALVVEVAALSLLAGGAGVALGYFIAGLLLPDVAASLRGLYGVAAPGALSFSPTWLLGGLAMSLAGGLAAAAAAFHTVYRLPPLASARPETWRRAQARRDRWRGALAGALAAAALALLAFGEGLAAGFAVMACVLGAAAAALPLALDLALRLCARIARGPVADWVWADMRQQLSGLSLALTALLLALSANIGVSAMVGGFRITFLDWLDHRLAAEVYVRGSDEAQARRIDDWARLRGDIDAVLPSRIADIVFRGRPAEMRGVADHPSFRANWPLLAEAPGGWAAVFAEKGVMINEQGARRLGLAPGDTIDLGGGPTLIAGVYADYGNPKAQVLGSLDWLAGVAPDARRVGTGLRVAPGRDAAVIADVTAAFDLSTDQVIDQAALKDAAVRVFERTFAVTGALSVLTLAVAGVALFTSMLTLADRRLGALAPLWAIGLSRRGLARIEMAKTLALALLTAVIATPLGVLLAWLLVSVINVEAFGWRLPLWHFPMDWLRLAGLSLVIAAVAAAPPILRLSRVSPGRLLQVFADAR